MTSRARANLEKRRTIVAEVEGAQQVRSILQADPFNKVCDFVGSRERVCRWNGAHDTPFVSSFWQSSSHPSLILLLPFLFLLLFLPFLLPYSHARVPPRQRDILQPQSPASQRIAPAKGGVSTHLALRTSNTSLQPA